MRAQLVRLLPIPLLSLLFCACGSGEPPGHDGITPQPKEATRTDRSELPQTSAADDASLAVGACGGWGPWSFTGATQCTSSLECPRCPVRGPCPVSGPALEQELRRCKVACPDRCETQWQFGGCGCRP